MGPLIRSLLAAGLLLAAGCTAYRAPVFPYDYTFNITCSCNCPAPSHPEMGAAGAQAAGKAKPPAGGYDVDLDGTNEVPRLLE